MGKEISTSLLSAYYPVVLTSASLIVCFWAEVFHLREIRWDRPRWADFLCRNVGTNNIKLQIFFFFRVVRIWIFEISVCYLQLVRWNITGFYRSLSLGSWPLTSSPTPSYWLSYSLFGDQVTRQRQMTRPKARIIFVHFCLHFTNSPRSSSLDVTYHISPDV